MDIVGLSGTNVFFVVFGFFIIILIYMGIQNVEEGNVRLVERLGKYHKTLRPGINFTLPGIDKVRKDFELYTFHEETKNGEKDTKRVYFSTSRGDISMKEHMIDPMAFETIAADNAVVRPDILCYFTIIDAHKAVYNVDNLGEQLLKLIETTIRQEVGKQNSDDLITSRQQIGINVQQELEKATGTWGTKINRVEIQEIKFKESIQEKLVEQREAELKKRGEVVEAQQTKEVMILEAEGIRQKEILEAEGKKQAQVLEAEGNFEAARLEAEGNYLLESRKREGEAKGLLAMGEALKNNPEALIILDALEAQAKVAASIGESNNALIIPSETAGLFGAIGSITKTLKMMENGFSSSNNQSDTNNENNEEIEIDKA